MQIQARVAAVAIAALSAGAASATDYYVAPQGATATCAADGSQACPYDSVATAFKAGKVVGGDKILLMDGYHGELKLTNITFTTPVTIQSQNAKNARLQDAYFGNGTQNLVLRNVKIWATDPHSFLGNLVSTTSGASNIVIDGVDARAGQDAPDYLKWSQAEWLARAVDGVMLAGANNIVQNSSFIGVRFGIQLVGSGDQAIGNLVDGYSGDGLRGNGNNNRLISNQVTNCISVDANHADGFQSFTTPSVPIIGLDIEGNVIIEWTHVAKSPLRCTLQGIGLFDGFYNNLTIRNNVVVVSAYHGIAVYGTHTAVIENNTVVAANGVAGKWPWITVNPHKNGQASTDVIVANNVAMGFGEASAANRITYTANSVVTNPIGMFQDFWSFNFVPRSDSGFIDTGDAAYATPTDILGAARPAGAGPDRGAYEVGGTGGRTRSAGPGVGLGVITWGKFTGGR